MASVLNLPSHADIHEFEVLYTNNKTQKRKEWHDGYLKWHTFNFRSILYDNQRKQIASDFFPNRAISSGENLEFAAVLVDVGDQLQSLQANLQHVYRGGQDRSEQSKHITRSPLRNPVATATTDQARQESPLLKRIYPVSALHTPSSLPVGSGAYNSSSTSYKRQKRSAGAVSLAKGTPRTNVIYPGGNRESAAASPGWFARHDVESSAVLLDSPLSLPRLPRAKAVSTRLLSSSSNSEPTAKAAVTRTSKVLPLCTRQVHREFSQNPMPKSIASCSSKTTPPEIFDAEANNWITDLVIDQHEGSPPKSVSVQCDEVLWSSDDVASDVPITPGISSEPNRMTFDQVIPCQSPQLIPLHLEERSSLPSRTILKETSPRPVPPEVDESGFLLEPCSPRKKRSPFKSTHTNTKLPNYIETFRETDGDVVCMTPFLLEMCSPPARAVSPLFLPDASQLSDLQPSQDGEKVIQQLAQRMAAEVAQHSSIKRVVPKRFVDSNKIEPKPLKLTIKRRQKRSLLSGRASASPQASGEVSLHPKDLSQSVQPAVSPICPTPESVATEEIDALFQQHDHSRALALLPPSKKAPLGLARHLPNKKIESTSKTKLTDEEGKHLATQICQRAPDFMSANSFHAGAILKLDQPIAAVGISARQIEQLDFSTQLTDC